MDMTLLVQFWGVAILFALTPGADWAYAIATGIRARTVAPSILGMMAGYAVVVTVVAVGAGALIAAYPAALTALSVLGGLYLVHMGVGALRSVVGGLTAAEGGFADSRVPQFLRGVGVSGTNPKGMLLLLALLPQFIVQDGWSSTAQMLVLGGLHIVDIAVIYLVVSLLARRLLSARPTASRAVTRLSGVVMIVLGLGILAETAAAIV